ncbi:MAG: type I-G CRISPR-associated protein Cas8g1/Csx17 [Thermoguttaceae bacterium]|jgi:CRISPR-associated protein Csx17
MTLHVHHLKGCSPAPLASYLKALGVLRLVAEQGADREARGWWQDEHFCLLTKLAQNELEDYFAETYAPTPVFNPWGGRSGYYSGSSEKTARNALAVIEASTIDRLSKFREAISVIRSVIKEFGGEKPDTEEAKAMMISQIRMRLRGAGADWLETVITDLGDSFRGPAILGTGGNEGSGSYTAAFLAAVVECVVRRAWNSSITSSLWSSDDSNRNSWEGSFQYRDPRSPKKLKKETVKQPFRQFLPEGEGSPWDLLLAFEGTVAVQSGVARRSSTDRSRFLTSPFYFAPLGIGSGSSSELDEFALNKGRKNPGRGEQWFPMWRTPSSYPEIRSLLKEGRCTAARRLAKNPLDAARAIGGLGIARGITTFLRYGYLQRNNLATHLAVPLGRIRVTENLNSRLIDDLSDWLDRIHRQARKSNAPARLVQAHKRLADAVFAGLTHDPSSERWQAVLRAAVGVESLQATGTAIEAGPIPRLRPEWVSAVNDNSVEVRLALSLGSAATGYSKTGRPIDPVRHHWLPLERGARKFKISDKRLVLDPRVVMSGRDALADCSAIVERRLIEAGMKGQRRLPLVAAPGCGARLSDLATLLSGTVDIDRVLDLARAFMAIQWDQWSAERRPPAPSPTDHPDEAWLALRLACLPWPLTRDRNIAAEPGVVRRLLACDSAGATAIALARLRSAGIRPPLQGGVADDSQARLWAAALVFPVDRRSALRMATILDPALKGSLHV